MLPPNGYVLDFGRTDGISSPGATARHMGSDSTEPVELIVAPDTGPADTPNPGLKLPLLWHCEIRAYSASLCLSPHLFLFALLPSDRIGTPWKCGQRALRIQNSMGLSVPFRASCRGLLAVLFRLLCSGWRFEVAPLALGEAPNWLNLPGHC